MLGTHHLLTFMLASLLLNITPGPDTMYIVSRSVAQGRWAGVLSVLGISTGCLIHTALAAFGLSAVLAASTSAFEVIKLAGAAYLIYLGVRAICMKRGTTESSDAPVFSKSVAIYRQGVLTNVLNPKVAIFFLAFLPQFTVSDSGLGPVPFLFLGLLFVVQGTLWCLVVVTLASFATEALRANQRVAAALEKLSGIVFVGLGVNLLRTKARFG